MDGVTVPALEAADAATELLRAARAYGRADVVFAARFHNFDEARSMQKRLYDPLPYASADLHFGLIRSHRRGQLPLRNYLQPHAEGFVPVSTFSYSGTWGPLDWAELTPAYCACRTGRQQSPIVLTTAIPTARAAPILDVPSREPRDDTRDRLERRFVLRRGGAPREDGAALRSDIFDAISTGLNW
ncbi:hypothetical protein FB451DRAFT_1407689 [Mycena latifolia]|nr:hypothetical protein FB451DRAFT_1407689 [Mycena latifolia]